MILENLEVKLMSSTWGEKVKLSIFGESHGAAIGVTIDGLPAGELIDFDEIAFQMSRRAPGNDPTSTSRKELDIPEILSGIFGNSTNGAPLCAIIRNNDTHSENYEQFSRIPRPGHADYTSFIRYKGHNDYHGGGHFSGRLTAPMVFAGAVCRQILSRHGVEIGAHLLSVAEVSDESFNEVNIDGNALKELTRRPFPVLLPQTEEHMRGTIEKAKNAGDSVGAVIECAVTGLPAGIGDPIFGGVENKLSSIIFGIPAVKGLEFGAGFSVASMRGSENNDPFLFKDGCVKTLTNRHGGILGGITSGMPIIFRAAFKPTPSIFLVQQSVDLETSEPASLQIHGRHDPCVAVRAVPVVEALTAVCIIDLYMGAFGNDIR